MHLCPFSLPLSTLGLLGAAFLAPAGAQPAAENQAGDLTPPSIIMLDVVDRTAGAPLSRSAVLIDELHVATAWHVMATAEDAWVNLGASVVPITAVAAADEQRDLVVLLLERPCEGRTPAALADELPSPCSDIVIYAPDEQRRLAARPGFVATRWRSEFFGERFTTSVEAFAGSGGAPAFDMRARLVGVVTGAGGEARDGGSECAGVTSLRAAMAEAGEPVPLEEWCARVTPNHVASQEHFFRAGELQGEGRIEESTRALGEAIAADPANYLARVHLVYRLAELRRFDEARRLFDDWPGDPALVERYRHNTELALLVRESRFDEMVDLVERVPRAERVAHDWQHLGAALLELGRRAEAIDALEAAARADDWDSWSLFTLARIAAEDGRAEDALAHAQAAGALDCSDSAIAMHSRVRYMLGEQEQAIAMLRESIEQRGPHPDLAAMLAWELGTREEFDAADEVVEDARRLHPDHPKLLEYALHIAMRRDDLARARELLGRYHAAGGTDAGIYAYVCAMAVRGDDRDFARRVVRWLEPLDPARATQLRTWMNR